MMGTWDYTPCARFHHLSVCQHYAGTIQRLERSWLVRRLMLLQRGSQF